MRQGWSSDEVRRSQGRDGREPDDGNPGKCGSPRGNLGQPRGGEDGGARGELGDARRSDATRRQERKELVKLSAAMAMAPPPSKSREREAERMDGRWVSVGWRGIHDGVDNLTSGANAGIRAPNGSQVLRPVSYDGGQSSLSGFAMLTELLWC